MLVYHSLAWGLSVVVCSLGLISLYTPSLLQYVSPARCCMYFKVIEINLVFAANRICSIRGYNLYVGLKFVSKVNITQYMIEY